MFSLPSPCAIRNNHGAAFLLGVYITSLALLLLSGVALQRTNQEVRAAQVSRDLQQAFWLAEAGLDRTLVTLKNDPNIDDASASGVLTYPSLGSVTYTVTTMPGSTGTRQITTRGTAGSLTQPQQLQATVQAQGYPQEGLWAGENIWLSNNAGDGSLPTITGTFRVAGGTAGALKLIHTAVSGPVSIGLSGMTSYSTTTYGQWGGYGASNPNSAMPYDDSRAKGFYVPGAAGVTECNPGGCTDSSGYTYGSGIQTLPGIPQQFSSTPQQTALTIPPRVDPVSDAIITPSTAPSLCTTDQKYVDNGHLELHGTQTKSIGDGDSLDRSPSGDGKVLLCLQSLVVEDKGQLTFTAPTTVYLVGTVPPDKTDKANGWTWGSWGPLNDDGGSPTYAHYPYVTYGQEEEAVVKVVQGSKTLKNGLELVVPTWAPEHPYYGRGRIFLAGGTFSGSISAPQSWVFIGRDSRLNPVRIVGMWISLDATGRDGFTLKNESGSSTTSQSPTPSILSWTN